MLSNEELMEVKGGAISGAVLDSVIKIMDKIFEIGASLGDSLTRLFSKKSCVHVTRS